MAKKYAVGDFVRVTNKCTVRHFTAHNISIAGTIKAIVPENGVGRVVGRVNRPYLIKFTDGREAWYAGHEIRRVNGRV